MDSVGPFAIIRPKYWKVKLGATRRGVKARLSERPWIEDEEHPFYADNGDEEELEDDDLDDEDEDLDEDFDDEEGEDLEDEDLVEDESENEDEDD